MEKFLKIIRYSIIGGIFLVPFLPLVISSSLFFPFITGKNFLFRILVEIIFALWVILAINDKRYRPKKSLILILLVAFVSIVLLSSVFGENFSRSFWSNFERMEGAITYLHLIAYFLILVTVINTEKLWKIFFHISIGVGLIVAFYGFFQLSGDIAIHQSDVRLDATLGNASYLAIYMVFNIFIAGLYFFKTKEWYKWFYLLFAAIYSIILYNTATRGTILGFIGGLILMAVLIALLSKNKKVRTITVSLFVLLMILLSVFWIFKDSDFIRNNHVLSRFSSISLEDGTTQSRFIIWGMSWEGFKEKPIFGWGLENYNLIFNKYYEPILYKQEPWFDRAHNVFFDRLTTNGIFGLLTYIGLFFVVFYYLILKRKKYGFSIYDSSIIVALFAAYFFHNIFVFDNLISFIFFFSFLGYIHSRLVRESNDEQIPLKEGKVAVSSAIVLIAFIFILYSVNIPGYLSAKNLLNALQFASVGNIESAFEKFEKAISYDSFGNSESREQLLSFASKVVNAQIDQTLKLEIINTAEEEMKKQLEKSPTNIRYMLFLSSFYNSTGQYDKAIDILNQAREVSPNKQQTYFELSSSYMNKGETEKALEFAKTVFEIEPTFDEARKIYAVVSIYAGNVEFGENLLEEEYGTYVVGDIRLINAYASVNQIDKVVEIWEKIIEEKPDNINYRKSLAAGYLALGERQKAIEQLQIAIEIDESFKEEGEFYINEIKAGRNP